MSLLAFIPAAVWRWAAVIGSWIVAVLAVLNLRARLSAANARARDAERRISITREAEEIEDDVEAMDRPAIDRSLARWMR